MSARLLPNLQPRWGVLTVGALDHLEHLHASLPFTLRGPDIDGATRPPATAHLGGDPDRLVRELIALSRWAILARAWADDHPRIQAGSLIRCADALMLGQTPAARRS